ncbi:aminotransferase class I/II-fold pyridoxal phosphate-dependent enzyme [Nocardioides sp. CFH 31398]|uniref:aminotransferase class I/II-fold pyridoxal phosphate-dependent enzyme n=1 Tax=Nocardioides sp. CFH 31398 TaxID=2919579 RepID=UPI001F056DF8|nr:aminotransferase class I/II-fold pyridoxal phosphate-dependent enzyme [Nocardioides sp. CFH 31398]MCH1865301.1 aminotransferase class I/II-fold pyridoxal phosphate-dependent enzyme [Nocardioides sp. CFH 31398]
MTESDNPIFQIADRAAALRATGVDVITLAAGEPDLPTATHIVDAAVDAARDPRNHRYGPAGGLPALRSRIADDGHPDHITADNVQVTVGTKHALHLALNALTSPRDDVLVLRPSWPGHLGAVDSVGATAVQVDVDQDGLASTTALEAARTPRTRAVVIANPSNPSGVLHERGLLADLAAWCVDHDIWLISDEVYGGLTFDTHRFSASNVVTDPSRLIVVDGVSKVHAMTGWRVGWLIGPTHVVANARRQVSATITHVSTIPQHAALAALSTPTAVHATTIEGYRTARDLLVGRLNTIPGVECPTPAGGMFAFPDIRELLDDRHPSSASLASRLLEDAHVAVVPSEVFNAEGRLRISFAVAHERLSHAAERLVRALTEGPT